MAQDFDCDLKEYSLPEGLDAHARGGAPQGTWQGERGDQLRAGFTISALQLLRAFTHPSVGKWQN